MKNKFPNWSFLVNQKQTKLFVLPLITLISSNLIYMPVARSMDQTYKIAEASREKNTLSYVISMPSTNYNQRPENTKIDTIIIHHTAPSPSLTRVGYFFQDINSRVSSHYIVGKEGLIIQSVDERDRSWHAGPSSWIGKYNVNDYSIGIEVLNDGDNKDPFTELQYSALTKLVAYLMKKYDVPLTRIIGHRDIAIPMGRKVDPADNFDWKKFKAKLRTQLSLPQNFLGMGDLPQESNININDVVKFLKSNVPEERGFAVDSLLTTPYKEIQNEVDYAFTKEYSEPVMSKFFRLFEVYEDKKYIEPAKGLFGKYNSLSPVLFNSVVSYLGAVDKENSEALFTAIFNDENLNLEKRIALIRVISNYKNEKIMNLLLAELNKTTLKEEKKVLIENLAKFENKSLNSSLLNYLSESNTADLRTIAIDTLRVSFDDNVENKLLESLKKETNTDVLEMLVSTLMRKDSKKAVTLLQSEDIYKKLNNKTRIIFINSLGRLKIAEAENWLINKTSSEIDENTRTSLFLALGRIKGEKSYSLLVKSFGKDLSSDLVILRSLSNYNKPEFSRAIKSLIEKESTPKILKIEAISIIKENKMNELLDNLKGLSIENADPEVQSFTEEVIKTLESQ